MSFTAAVYEAISGKQARYARVSVATMLTPLLERFGSNVRVAADIGVSEAAIRRWRGGATPRNREALVAAYRRATTDPHRLRQARTDGDWGLVLDQPDGGKGKGRPRLITASGLSLRPGTMDAVVDAYLEGDDLGAAEALYDGITDDFYASHIVPDFLTDTPDQFEDDGYGIY